MMRQIIEYYKILVEHEIVRRYIIINSFDGVLTILGIIVAVFMSGLTEPELIIIPTVGASIAMCVSGIWGSYAAERAEIRKKIHTMEAHLMKSLSGTEFSNKRERMAWVIGIVDGVIPLILALILILPFFFVKSGLLSITSAYYIALTMIGINLFMLGAFAGKIAKESMLKQGVMMVFAGIVISAIFLILTKTGIM
ncbi:MAG: VIT1/CCC1 transporter family protein [Candidatus Woesearchaeota archaeon]